MKILGLITARGGSKGIPGKNIKALCGKPLIVYTIEAAKESGVFDRIILSTDDEKIAAVAREQGVQVPFLRPAELAQDATPHLPVAQHAIQTLREIENYIPDYVMILQPTVPFRQARHIREAVDLGIRSGADSVVSVTELEAHANPMWAITVDDEGLARLFAGGEPMHRIVPRRQELPKAYTKDGAIFLFKTEVLFHPQTPSLYGERTAAYVMDAKYAVNIDTMEDWERAERIIVKGLA